MTIHVLTSFFPKKAILVGKSNPSATSSILKLGSVSEGWDMDWVDWLLVTVTLGFWIWPSIGCSDTRTKKIMQNNTIGKRLRQRDTTSRQVALQNLPLRRGSRERFARFELSFASGSRTHAQSFLNQFNHLQTSPPEYPIRVCYTSSRRSARRPYL